MATGVVLGSGSVVQAVSSQENAQIKDAMRIAHAILQYIKELRLPCLSDCPMECLRPDLFEGGPAWRIANWKCQTKTGFILEMSYGSPALLTPLGEWPAGIVSHRTGSEVTEMMNAIEGPLGLTLRQDVETVEGWGDHGPYYNVTKWEGKDLPVPTHPTEEELISRERIKALWKELTAEFFPN